MISEYRLALDSGKIGAEELVKDFLEKIEKDTSNSFISVCAENAFEDASQAQKIIDDGMSKSLTGIPLAIKDNICTAGVATTCASRMLKDFVPTYDATAVKKLKSQNAVIAGKTNMDEFGMGDSSQLSLFEGVKNPLNSSKIPGGSSGGSCAAVKSGLCVAALGSDTGGSVRQPAVFCGLVGLKPTYGRVSRYGLISFASSLEQIGIVANTAQDAGILLECISGSDLSDMSSADYEPYNHVLKCNKKIKIGIHEHILNECSSVVSDKISKAIDAFVGLGYEVAPIVIPSYKKSVDAYYKISSAEAWSNLSRFDGIRYGFRASGGEDYASYLEETRKNGFGEEVKKRIQYGSEVLINGEYFEALKIRKNIIDEYNSAFADVDVILSPAHMSEVPDVGNDTQSFYLKNLCTVQANLAGLPAAAFPCGTDKNDMPVGLNLTAKKFDEGLLLSIATAFERGVGYGI